MEDHIRKTACGGRRVEVHHCIPLAVAIHFETLHHADKHEGTQLDFTAWAASLKSMTEIVQVLAGLGFVTAALAYARYQLERLHWRRFKQLADAWIASQVELKARGPGTSGSETAEPPPELTLFRDDVLTVVVEQMLNESGFTPIQIQQLLQTALLITRGMAADRFLI